MEKKAELGRRKEERREKKDGKSDGQKKRWN